MRLIFCDDHRIVAEALATALQSQGHEVLAITTSPADAIAAVSAHEPDICLLDLFFGGEQSGLEAARAITRLSGRTKILVLSGAFDPDLVAEAMATPVAGFIRKDQDLGQIVLALEVIGAGGVVIDSTPRRPHAVGRPSNPMSMLTEREREVASRIAQGEDTVQMATAMNIAAGTVRSHVKSVLAKLGAHSRPQIAVIVSSCGEEPSGTGS